MERENFNGRREIMKRIYGTLRYFAGENKVYDYGDTLMVSTRNNEDYDLILKPDGMTPFIALYNAHKGDPMPPDGRELVPGSVGTEELKDGAVTEGKLSDDVQEKMNSAVDQETLAEAVNTAVSTKQDIINDLDTIRSGASAGATAYQKPATGIPSTELTSEVQATLTIASNDHQLIPDQASSENQLADKAFVNSSIATATATYRGNYNIVTQLNLAYNASNSAIATALDSKVATADNNDYCFVQIPASNEDVNTIVVVKRFKFDGTSWSYEYKLNNSGFTAAQWAAINSAITSGLVSKLTDLPDATTLASSLAGKQNVINDLATIRSGANAGATAYQKPQTGIPASDIATGVIPDISGKADKVNGAVNGHLAGLDSNGNLTGSGVVAADVVTSSSVRTVVLITQADYDALATKDANTEYNIIESV